MGQLQYEGWGYGKPKLFLKVEELVLREGIRRGLSMENHYLDMMLHGFINKETWEDIWTSEQLKARKKRERQAARQSGEEVGAGASSLEKKQSEESESKNDSSEGKRRDRKKRGPRNTTTKKRNAILGGRGDREDLERGSIDGLCAFLETTDDETNDDDDDDNDDVSSVDENDNVVDMDWEGHETGSV